MSRGHTLSTAASDKKFSIIEGIPPVSTIAKDRSKVPTSAGQLPVLALNVSRITSDWVASLTLICGPQVPSLLTSSTLDSLRLQSYGPVERMHRTLRESLQAHLTSLQWSDEHSWVLFGLWTTTKLVSVLSQQNSSIATTLSCPES